MRKEVTIGNETWEIYLDTDKQVSFSYRVPLEKSEWRNDPMWFTFDENDASNMEEYSYFSSGVTKTPFRVKGILLNALVSMIQQSHTDFFYFYPTTKQRGKIYANLIDELLGRLGGWSCQHVDQIYFYFYKNQ